METRAAVYAVFDIPELLEAILLELPCLQLFTAQRVAPSWLGAVASSSKLQKAMFLRQSRPMLGSPRASADEPVRALNEELRHIDPKASAAHVYDLLTAETEHVYLNPFLLKILCDGPSGFALHNHGQGNKPGTLLRGILEKGHSALTSGSGSWEDISLTSPPLARRDLRAFYEASPSANRICYLPGGWASSQFYHDRLRDECFTLRSFFVWIDDFLTDSWNLEREDGDREILIIKFGVFLDRQLREVKNDEV